MKEIQVSHREEGQRLDKLLGRYLNTAPVSFLYKMMRKKNITLNGKKASGNETVHQGDCIKIFLSDDNWKKFSNIDLEKEERAGTEFERIPPLKKEWILYEDDHILLLNKPAGVLSQKAQAKDCSINEQMISYLLHTGQITQKSLQTFRPSVCNRLDRNTSGLLLVGKTIQGLQELSSMLKERSVHKYYCCMVAGQLSHSCRIEGYLWKDEKKNQVTVFKNEVPDAKKIITEYHPLKVMQTATLLEVLLVTGRSHQIRAHLSSIGHPIIGDGKYGIIQVNRQYEKIYRVQHQMLHAYKIVFPEMTGTLSYLSGKEFRTDLPKEFQRVLKGES